MTAIIRPKSSSRMISVALLLLLPLFAPVNLTSAQKKKQSSVIACPKCANSEIKKSQLRLMHSVVEAPKANGGLIGIQFDLSAYQLLGDRQLLLQYQDPINGPLRCRLFHTVTAMDDVMAQFPYCPPPRSPDTYWSANFIMIVFIVHLCGDQEKQRFARATELQSELFKIRTWEHACNSTTTFPPDSVPGQAGLLTSPGYAQSLPYPNGLNCIHQFKMPKDKLQLKVTIESLDLPGCSATLKKCGDDAIQVGLPKQGFPSSCATFCSPYVGANAKRSAARTIGSSSTKLFDPDTAVVSFRTSETRLPNAELYCGAVLSYTVESVETSAREKREAGLYGSDDCQDQCRPDNGRHPQWNSCADMPEEPNAPRTELLKREPIITTIFSMSNLDDVVDCPEEEEDQPVTPQSNSVVFETTEISTAATTNDDNAGKLLDDYFLKRLVETRLNLSNVHDVLVNLSAILPNLSLDAADMADISLVLSHAASVKDVPAEDAELFVTILNRLLKESSDSFTQQTSDGLLNAIETLASNAKMGPGSSLNFSSGSNFALIIASIDCNQANVQLGISKRFQKGNYVEAIMDDADAATETESLLDTEVSIQLDRKSICPSPITPQKQKNDIADEIIAGAEKLVESLRLIFQVHQTPKLFVDESDKAKLDRGITRDGATFGQQLVTSNDGCVRGQRPNSEVVSASVIRRPPTSTDDPQSSPAERAAGDQSSTPSTASGMKVQIAFKRKPLAATMLRNFRWDSSYWDRTNHRWITGSCKLTKQLASIYAFETDHLTDFALLVSNNPKDPAFCDECLKILGSIGLLLSVGALAVVLASLIFIRVTTTSANRTIYSLSICFNLTLLLLFFTFFLFADQQYLRMSDDSCSRVAAALYFFQLSLMLWTLSRAHMVYKRYVVVFDRGMQCTARLSFTTCWAVVAIGVPSILVLATFFSYNEMYQRTDFYCWLNPDKILYATVIPFSVIISMSILVTILVARNIFARQKLSAGAGHSGPNSSVANCASWRRKLWVIFIIQMSLGLPWVFQYFIYMGFGSTVFHYLFTIASAFQGVWVALIYLYERRRDSSLMFRRLKQAMRSIRHRPNRIDHAATSANMTMSAAGGLQTGPPRLRHRLGEIGSPQAEQTRSSVPDDPQSEQGPPAAEAKI